MSPVAKWASKELEFVERYQQYSGNCSYVVLLPFSLH
jgi:hypothetical protein